MSENKVAVKETGLSAELSGNSSTMYTSLKAETPEEKARLFNAMSNPTNKVNEMIGKVIEVQDIYAEMIEMTNEDTGEVSIVPRTVMISPDGKSYQAVSQGIYSAIKRLHQIYGPPTWDPAVKIEIKQVKSGVNSVLTFQVIA